MIAPISPLASLPALRTTGAPAPRARPAQGRRAGSSGTGSDFHSAVTDALDQVQHVQTNASSAAAQAAAGHGNIADAIIASTQAVARDAGDHGGGDKAVTAFNSIMNMQV